MTITVEMLEGQQKELQKMLERIQNELKLTEDLIALRRGQPAGKSVSFPPKITATSYSVRGRVVDGIIELIHNLGKQVGNK